MAVKYKAITDSAASDSTTQEFYKKLVKSYNNFSNATDQATNTGSANDLNSLAKKVDEGEKRIDQMLKELDKQKGEINKTFQVATLGFIVLLISSLIGIAAIIVSVFHSNNDLRMFQINLINDAKEDRRIITEQK